MAFGLKHDLRAIARRYWLVLAVGAGMLAVTIAAAGRLEYLDSRILEQNLERIGLATANEIENYYTERFAAASIARKTLQYASNISPDRLVVISDALRREYPQIVAVNFINPERIITFVSPEGPNRPALGQKVGQSPAVIALLDEAQNQFRDVATGPVSLFQGNKGVVMYLPIIHRDRFEGFMNIVMAQPGLEPMRLGISEAYSVTVKDGDEVLWHFNTVSNDGPSYVQQFKVLNRNMSVTVRRSTADTLLLNPASPGFVLTAGIIFSFIFMFLFARLLQQQRVAREATRRLERFNSMSSDWLWEQDAELRFTYVSESNVKITGMPVEVHYGRTRRETRPLDVTDEKFHEHERLLANHMPFTDFRFSRINNDGRKVFLSISGEPVFNRQGRFLGYRGVGRNLTTETVLNHLSALESDVLEMVFRGEAKSEILLHLIQWMESLNASTHVTIMLSDQRTNKLVRGLGPSMPFSYMQAIEGLDIRAGNGACGTAAATRKTIIIGNAQEDPLFADYRELAQRHDLNTVWSIPVMSPSGNLLGVFAIYHDQPNAAPTPFELQVAEQCARLAALAIERSREREQVNLITLAFSRIDEGVIMTDHNGVILTANPAAAHLTGYDEKDLIGRNVMSIQKQGHDFDVMMLSVREHGYWQGEITGIRKDGVTISLRQSLTVVRDQNGTTLNYVGTFFDVSEQKRRERELLEARIAADTANRAKSMFLANMSHELRTPLNAIIGLSEVIGSEALGPLGNQKYKEYLDDILMSSKHLLSLINDILDLTKIVEFGAQIRRQRIGAAQVVETALPSIRRQALDKSIDISVSIVPPDMEIFADERAVRQMLINIIGNAVKFTPQHGHISLNCRRSSDDTATVFTIKDTGPGMPDDEIARVGQPFLQVRDIYTSGGSGTGLGLAITKSLVKGHSGTVSLRNHPDGGLEVEIVIPD